MRRAIKLVFHEHRINCPPLRHSAGLQLEEHDDSACRAHPPKVWQGICDREQYREASSIEEAATESSLRIYIFRGIVGPFSGLYCCLVRKASGGGGRYSSQVVSRGPSCFCCHFVPLILPKAPIVEIRVENVIGTVELMWNTLVSTNERVLHF